VGEKIAGVPFGIFIKVAPVGTAINKSAVGAEEES
jgi:hypothetical protein